MLCDGVHFERCRRSRTRAARRRAGLGLWRVLRGHVHRQLPRGAVLGRQAQVRAPAHALLFARGRRLAYDAHAHRAGRACARCWRRFGPSRWCSRGTASASGRRASCPRSCRPVTLRTRSRCANPAGAVVRLLTLGPPAQHGSEYPPHEIAVQQLSGYFGSDEAGWCAREHASPPWRLGEAIELRARRRPGALQQLKDMPLAMSAVGGCAWYLKRNLLGAPLRNRLPSSHRRC
jgi:hypothetical protein